MLINGNFIYSNFFLNFTIIIFKLLFNENIINPRMALYSLNICSICKWRNGFIFLVLEICWLKWGKRWTSNLAIGIFKLLFNENVINPRMAWYSFVRTLYLVLCLKQHSCMIFVYIVSDKLIWMYIVDLNDALTL